MAFWEEISYLLRRRKRNAGSFKILWNSCEDVL